MTKEIYIIKNSFASAAKPVKNFFLLINSDFSFPLTNDVTV